MRLAILVMRRYMVILSNLLVKRTLTIRLDLPLYLLIMRIRRSLLQDVDRKSVGSGWLILILKLT